MSLCWKNYRTNHYIIFLVGHHTPTRCNTSEANSSKNHALRSAYVKNVLDTIHTLSEPATDPATTANSSSLAINQSSKTPFYPEDFIILLNILFSYEPFIPVPAVVRAYQRAMQPQQSNIHMANAMELHCVIPLHSKLSRSAIQSEIHRLHTRIASNHYFFKCCSVAGHRLAQRANQPTENTLIGPESQPEKQLENQEDYPLRLLAKLDDPDLLDLVFAQTFV